jgi:ribose transport system substrate-binding protein
MPKNSAEGSRVRCSATPSRRERLPLNMAGIPMWRNVSAAIRRCGSLLVSVVLCAGCGHRGPATIAVIAPAGGLHYWEVFDRQVQTEAASAGIHLELQAPQSITDYTEQEQMVEDAISKHVQGIIVAPSHQLVLASVLEKAERSHISVVVIGAPIALRAHDFAAFISWDEEEAGRLAARRFFTLLRGKGEVGIVGVSPTVEGSSRIEEGFISEIAKCPRIKLVDVKYGLSDWARARQATLDLLAEYPNIGGIFTSDEFATHAAAYALDTRSKKRPALIGVSEERDELEALRQNKIDALVVSDPQDLARRAIQAMTAALAQRTTYGMSTQLPVEILDRQNVDTDPIARMLDR